MANLCSLLEWAMLGDSKSDGSTHSWERGTSRWT